MLFEDRKEAGRQLVQKLIQYKGQKDVIVLGLARGGMVPAAEIASGLHLPLNVIVVRKIGVPGNPELALGAIAEHGDGIFNAELIQMLGISTDVLKKEIERQKMILKERLALYRGKAQSLDLRDKIVILVDDGIATGASMRVAIQSMRHARVKKIVLAVPVAAPESLRKISAEVDETVCLYAPSFFEAVGAFYRKFDQTSDEEVIRLLSSSK
jgi:putative phosphoribosyl transferase